MANRIFGLFGWLGMALVVAALGIKFGMPAKDQHASGILAGAGFVCLLVYLLSDWREIAKTFSRRQARLRHAPAPERRRRVRDPDGDQLHRDEAEQAVGSHVRGR